MSGGPRMDEEAGMGALASASVAHGGISSLSLVLDVITVGTVVLCSFTGYLTICFLRSPPSQRKYSLLIFPLLVGATAIAVGFTGYWFNALSYYAKTSILMFCLQAFSMLSILFSLFTPPLDWVARHLVDSD